MLHNLLNVSYLLGAYGYVGIFLIILIESGIFFFLPGDSLLFAAGLLAAGGHLSLTLILILGLVAAYLGNIVGYWIGTHVERLNSTKVGSKIFKEAYIARARDFFDRRGKAALVLARFIPAVRTATPWVAGIITMDKRTFYLWSLIGAVAWVTVMTCAGFFLGKTFPGIEKYLTEAIVVIIVLSLIPAIFEWWRHRQSKAGK